MKEIRLGTIGSGEIVRNILNGVSETPGITLAAVYSRSYEKAAALGGDYGCGRAYTDLDAMLADGDINTIYVASPNSLHYGYAKKALLAGKHVICEKPFCPELRQAEELFSLAERKGLMLVEAVPTTFLPNYALLAENLGKIGRLRLVSGNYSQYSGRYDKLRQGQVTNVFDPAFAGGTLMDLNFYNVYLTLALFGAPLAGEYHPNVQGGIDTSGVVSLHYPDFQATLVGAKDARGMSFYQIQGEDGFLYVEDGPNGLKNVRACTKEEDRVLNLQEIPNRWYYEIRNLTPVLLDEDRERLYALRNLSLLTCKWIEQMRKEAGIRFPSDQS